MSINTTKTAMHHVKLVTQNLQNGQGLPFTNILSAQSIANKLLAVEYRNRVYSPDVTVFGFLSQVTGADQSCQAAVAQIIGYLASQGKPIPSANTSAYSQARERLPLAVLSDLAREAATRLEQEALIGWLWHGRHVKIVDGSTVSMPDTEANQEMYPQPGTQKEGAGFPLARIVALLSLATGAVLDLAVGPYSGKKTGEHALLRQLLDNFQRGDIVLGDEYYGSYFLIAQLIKLGVDCVFPQHSARNTDFRKGYRLGKKDHIVTLTKPAKPAWMDDETYACGEILLPPLCGSYTHVFMHEMLACLCR